jgi:hypothetical protein
LSQRTKERRHNWAREYAQEWHDKTHASLGALKHLIKNDKTISSARREAVCSLKQNELQCLACGLSKSTKKHPRPIERPVEWWTSDASGKFRRSFLGNEWMYVTVDPAGWGHTEFGKYKGEAQRTIQAKKKLWEKEYGAAMTHHKSDRGGEYSSAEFKNWAAREGLTLAYTAPNSSAGPAERKIRTVQERGKAMGNHAAMMGGMDPNTFDYFWDEQCAYAQQVDWMMPSANPRLGGMSPWQYRHHEPPPVQRLHPWGCKAIANKPSSGKYANRGRLAMFLGLARNGDDGYRLFDFTTRSIFHSRSVEFFDHLFFRDGERGRESSWTRDAAGASSSRGPGSIPGSGITDKPDGAERTSLEAARLEEEERLRAAINGQQFNRQQQQQEEEAIEQEDLEPPMEDNEEYGELPLPVNDEPRGQRARTQRSQFDPTLWAQEFARQNIQDNERAHIAARMAYSMEAGIVPEAHWQAMACEDSALWKKAEEDEKNSLKAKAVMRRIRRSKIPRGKKTITCRWAYDIKRKDGKVERYKARLVARGFLQRAGLDYGETFAPTPSLASIRLVVALALQLGFKVHHQDVKTAFLEARLPKDERVYVEPPPGIECHQDFCFELLKCLYGLKQSAAKWNQHIDTLLKAWGFKSLSADACVYTHLDSQGNIDCIVTCHVDDLLIAAPTKVINKVKDKLASKLNMKNLGVLSWYLGIKFTFGNDCVEMSQRAFILEILEKYRMTNANPSAVPAVSSNSTTASRHSWQTQAEYRSLIGSLQYLTLTTRPDIAYAVGLASQKTGNPQPCDWLAAKRILRYLVGTKEHGLRFVKTTNTCSGDIVGFSDSDWAGSPDRKSTSGFVFMFSGGAISWKCKKQSVVARSSAEAEIIALDTATKEALWLRKLKKSLHIGNPNDTSITIHEDNEAAIAISAKHRRTERTKHIDVRYFAVSDDVEEQRIKIAPVASAENTADIFTKPLDKNKLTKFRKAMGVHTCQQSNT